MARVLVVDDAAFMRMLVKKILTQAGHQVLGRQATERRRLRNTNS